LPVAYCREDVEADEEKIKTDLGRELNGLYTCEKYGGGCKTAVNIE